MALTLKAMTYFTTALRHGNITKAATELNIAASAISGAIDQVEAEFDLRLVTRQRAKGIQANANGRKIAEKCARLLEEYQSVLSDGADLKHALNGTLRIGYYAPIAPAFLPQILDSFLPTNSAMTLDLVECDNDAAQDGLLNGAFDVILFVAEGVRAPVDYEPLVAAPPYCLLPEVHPLSHQPTVSMAQIAREPLVVLNRPIAAAYYTGLFKPGSRSAPVVAYANSTEMVRSLVAAGRGCAILNMRPQTSESYFGARVVARPISEDLTPLTLAIGYDKARPRRSVTEFVRACHAHFAIAGKAQCIVQS